ncbi:MAG: hypothetical protein R3A46_04385, partial [Thermomicrobiales bacterium]
MMNPNATAAQATVTWVNPSGFGADNFGTSAVAIPGFANGFVYTMTQGNLPNGFYGSAVLTSTLPVAAVTTQVDYQVEWDGTAVWLGYNPCGYYRDNGFDDRGLEGFGADFNCNLGDPFNTAGGQVSKTFHDENGDAVAGVYAELWNEAYYQQVEMDNESFAGIPWTAGGYSNIDGNIEWTNVPVGTYYLYVGSVPTNNDGEPADMYEGAGVIEGPFTLNEGEDYVIDNIIDRILPTKLVDLADDAAGMEICLHADDNDNGNLDDDEVASPEYCLQADEDGNAFFDGIEPGWYFVSTNGGFEFDVLVGFNSPAYVSEAEYFGLGGTYVNDLADDVVGAEGTLQKVILLPEDLCGDVAETALQGDVDACPNLEISGVIAFLDANGDLEAEGNVQTFVLEDFGLDGVLAFSLTDVNVPVGGPYT